MLKNSPPNFKVLPNGATYFGTLPADTLLNNLSIKDLTNIDLGANNMPTVPTVPTVTRPIVLVTKKRSLGITTMSNDNIVRIPAGMNKEDIDNIIEELQKVKQYLD